MIKSATAGHLVNTGDFSQPNGLKKYKLILRDDEGA